MAEKLQTIYTQIPHGGNCSGCANITYGFGEISISVTCNQCGEPMVIEIGELSAIKEEAKA